MRTREIGLVAAALTIVGGVALAGLPVSPPQTIPRSPMGTLDAAGQTIAELDVAKRTREALEQKLDEREVVVKKRVRALYKLVRGGLAPLWIDEAERARLVRTRAAARRVIVRDLEERKALADELDRAREAEDRLAGEVAQLAAHQESPLAPKSFTRPVPGALAAPFGLWIEPTSKARMLRPGVELTAVAGEQVIAPAAGAILYTGPLRGLGQTVIIDQGAGVLAVVAGLRDVSVGRGDHIAAGSPLGAALGPRVLVEILRDGRAIDPTALIR
jgi:septal ring factor EnvC (AmiA/AmiB activator)